jgi:thioredoxin reductase (NADPH)
VSDQPLEGRAEEAGLDRRIALDEKGFVLTDRSPQMSLQTSSPGVFAVGDVRAGSVKRVAAGVGEGAAAFAQIHGCSRPSI